jgi:hypothetical protein
MRSFHARIMHFVPYRLVESEPRMQGGTAMLFLFLTPWVVLSLCTASPLPEVFWDPRS